MKKTALIFSLFGMMMMGAPSFGAPASAKASKSSVKEASNSSMAWGIGLGTVAVLATMAGVIAASASSSSHVH